MQSISLSISVHVISGVNHWIFVSDKLEVFVCFALLLVFVALLPNPIDDSTDESDSTKEHPAENHDNFSEAFVPVARVPIWHAFAV